jgi:hypothetical protein
MRRGLWSTTRITCNPGGHDVIHTVGADLVGGLVAVQHNHGPQHSSYGDERLEFAACAAGMLSIVPADTSRPRTGLASFPHSATAVLAG